MEMNGEQISPEFAQDFANYFRFKIFVRNEMSWLERSKIKMKQKCGVRLQFEKNCWKLAPHFGAGIALTRRF